MTSAASTPPMTSAASTPPMTSAASTPPMTSSSTPASPMTSSSTPASPMTSSSTPASPMTSSSTPPPMSYPRFRRDAPWRQSRPPSRRPRWWPSLGRPPRRLQRRSSRRRHQTRPRWIRGHWGRRPTTSSPLHPPLFREYVGHLESVHRGGILLRLRLLPTPLIRLCAPRDTPTGAHMQGRAARVSALLQPPAAITRWQSAHLRLIRARSIKDQWTQGSSRELSFLMVYLPSVACVSISPGSPSGLRLLPSFLDLLLAPGF
nr:uncharacterized protein DKFZp434B061-like [Nerophis lumbriciformis]